MTHKHPLFFLTVLCASLPGHLLAWEDDISTIDGFRGIYRPIGDCSVKNEGNIFTDLKSTWRCSGYTIVTRATHDYRTEVTTIDTVQTYDDGRVIRCRSKTGAGSAIGDDVWRCR
jgi:hypothetical protein